MPFAGYPDFDACVAANQDKDDPEAYCAAIKQQVEGKMTELLGVEIFSAGSQTDSSGFTNTFTVEDIDRIVEQFNAGTPEYVPVKLGHTSDQFNAQVAARLNVPVESLQGENGEDGVISLGQVTRLRRVQDDLIADFDVPSEMADLVDRGFLRDVSVEMMGKPGNWTLTGVAWLGAELPAVKGLNGLAAAATLRQQMMGPVMAFKRTITRKDKKTMSLKESLANLFKSADDAELNALFQDGEDTPPEGDGEGDGGDTVASEPIGGEVAAAIRAIAGCDINCSDEELLSALRGLVGLPEAGGAEEMVPIMKARLAHKPVKFAETAEYKTMASRIKTLERGGRLSYYKGQTAGLLIQGKDEDLAEELVSLEEKAGPEVASDMLASWKRESDANKRYTQASGSSATAPANDEHPFNETIKTYMSEHKVDRRVAMARLAMNPATSEQFNEYRRASSGVEA